MMKIELMSSQLTENKNSTQTAASLMVDMVTLEYSAEQIIHGTSMAFNLDRELVKLAYLDAFYTLKKNNESVSTAKLVASAVLSNGKTGSQTYQKSEARNIAKSAASGVIAFKDLEPKSLLEGRKIGKESSCSITSKGFKFKPLSKTKDFGRYVHSKEKRLEAALYDRIHENKKNEQDCTEQPMGDTQHEEKTEIVETSPDCPLPQVGLKTSSAYHPDCDEVNKEGKENENSSVFEDKKVTLEIFSLNMKQLICRENIKNWKKNVSKDWYYLKELFCDEFQLCDDLMKTTIKDVRKEVGIAVLSS